MIVYQLNYDPTVGFCLTENIFKEHTGEFFTTVLDNCLTKSNSRIDTRNMMQYNL